PRPMPIAPPVANAAIIWLAKRAMLPAAPLASPATAVSEVATAATPFCDAFASRCSARSSSEIPEMPRLASRVSAVARTSSSPTLIVIACAYARRRLLDRGDEFFGTAVVGCVERDARLPLILLAEEDDGSDRLAQMWR